MAARRRRRRRSLGQPPRVPPGYPMWGSMVELPGRARSRLPPPFWWGLFALAAAGAGYLAYRKWFAPKPIVTLPPPPPGTVVGVVPPPTPVLVTPPAEQTWQQGLWQAVVGAPEATQGFWRGPPGSQAPPGAVA